MRKILAVSGGVDSMVMLDVFAARYSSGDISSSGIDARDEIIVAHFDHGIRKNSALDADFVKRKAEEYGFKFCLGRGNLAKNTSEAEARVARYDFLRKIDPFATIYTAHHLDDLVETVIINLWRGTGWRGLAVLDTNGIKRPFLEKELFYEPLDKVAITEYAAKKKLTWREDQSNSSDEYLRNRIRHEMNKLDLNFEKKMQFYEIWLRQKTLKLEIDDLTTAILPEVDTDEKSLWLRKWFRKLNEGGLEHKVALELLRAGTLRAGISATRPQLEDFRQAILNYAPGKKFNLPGDQLVKLSKDDFWL